MEKKTEKTNAYLINNNNLNKGDENKRSLAQVVGRTGQNWMGAESRSQTTSYFNANHSKNLTVSLPP